MPDRLPIHPPYARSVAARAAILSILVWLVGLVLMAVSDEASTAAAAPAGSGSLTGAVVASVLVPLLVTALVLIDVRTYREHVFHANLGTPPALVAGIAFAVAFGLQAAALLAWVLVAGRP